jgi:hypothetical protein
MISTQHLNLLDEAMRPRRERFSSVDGLRALVVLLVVIGLLDAGLRVAAGRAAVAAQAAQQQLMALQSHPLAASAPVAGAPSPQELAALQRRYASSQRVFSAIQSGAAGSVQGYSQYLTALARQSQNLGGRPLWITELAIAPDGAGLDLTGRMTDPRVLPEYLNRLNGEPLVRGRAFGQVSLKALPRPGDLDATRSPADAPLPGGVTEFALHARPTGPTLALSGLPAGSAR